MQKKNNLLKKKILANCVYLFSGIWKNITNNNNPYFRIAGYTIHNKMASTKEKTKVITEHIHGNFVSYAACNQWLILILLLLHWSNWLNGIQWNIFFILCCLYRVSNTSSADVVLEEKSCCFWYLVNILNGKSPFLKLILVHVGNAEIRKKMFYMLLKL